MTYSPENPLEIYAANDLDKIPFADSTKKPTARLATVSNKQLHLLSKKSNPTTESGEGFTNTQTEPVEIFITSGTTVIGLENIYNVKLVALKAKAKPKKVENSALSEQVKLAEKNSQEKLAVTKKAKELNIKTEVIFYADPSGNSDIKKQSGSFFAAVISPFNVLQKSVLASSNSKHTATIKLEEKKQKFATSLSYLQFGPLINSFLRGPPNFS
ncbi:hypothetical protein [Chryseobacterium sp. MP_3.2]|uniref:hypothetical protein n=1 Tax=Chryseobacterium sp. MP_3.2 TaxID=3071712 RepID=UPI002E153AE8